MNELLNTYKTPKEIQKIIADNVRSRRQAMGLTQEEFSEKCDISFGTYKRFENQGEISLASLVKIGKILDSDNEFINLFIKKEYTSIEEIINERNK